MVMLCLTLYIIIALRQRVILSLCTEKNMALRAEQYSLLIWITEIYGYIVMVLLTGQLIRHMQKQLPTMCILMHLMQTIIYVR